MKRFFGLKNIFAALCCALLCAGLSVPALAADAADGSKTGNLSPAYGFIALLSVILALIILLSKQRRDKKIVCLFFCVAMANCGYFFISVSNTVSVAVWANRLAYFGCAFAVLMMLLIIAEVCGAGLRKRTKALLAAVSFAAFFLAATGGWLDIYYTSVWIENINGMTVLMKTYAPLHILYTLYITAYFALMIAVIINAYRKGRIGSVKYAIFLVAIVFGNIAVWGIEQLINIDFEFLSISYLTTTVFLLLMRLVMEDYRTLYDEHSRVGNMVLGAEHGAAVSAELPPDMEKMFSAFIERVATLTASERMVLQHQIDGCGLEETAEKLFISVNTARKHSSNLRRKLEVGSREELGLYIDLFRRAGRIDEISYMK